MMKALAVALILLFASSTVAAARGCFLFFCPQPYYHVHRSPAPVTETPFCKGVVAAFAKSNSNEDKFVSAFAATKQDQVRACLK